MLTAISVELLKVRHARIWWISLGTAIVFPALIGLVMTGAVGVDSIIEVERDARAYFMQFELVLAIGGLIGFGFLFSWIFGREYSDGTVTELLALPISRTNIVAAKFIVATVWCVLLAMLHFGIGIIFTWGALGGAATTKVIPSAFGKYWVTFMMVVVLSMPVALIASLGRGYLAPLGFVVLAIVVAQLLSAVGVASYFPWAIPGLYSGVAGEAAMQLGCVSLALPFVVGLLGLAATLAWWRYADQT